MRPIGRFQSVDLVGAEGQVHRREGVLEMTQLGRADDRSRHGGPAKQPGEGDLRRRRPAFAGHLAYDVDDIEVSVVVHPIGQWVAAGADGSLLAVTFAAAGEEATSQRAPGDHADALVEAERNHLALLLAVDQVVVVLHRDEPTPTGDGCDLLRLRELPGEHARRADVARLAGPHDVVQRPHRLLDRRLVVPAMDLVEVDVVGAEAGQRGVDGRHDVLARQATVIGSRAHREVDLRRQHVVLATREQLAQQPPGDLLGHAVGVGVGGVEERHTGLDGVPDDRLGLGFVEVPGPFLLGAVAHHAEADPGHLESRAAQSCVLHCSSFGVGTSWSATPPTTTAIPTSSAGVGNCCSTTAPMTTANTGSRASMRANVARGSRAMASWSVTYGMTDEQIATPNPASSKTGSVTAVVAEARPIGVATTAATIIAAPSWSMPLQSPAPVRLWATRWPRTT